MIAREKRYPEFRIGSVEPQGSQKRITRQCRWSLNETKQLISTRADTGGIYGTDIATLPNMGHRRVYIAEEDKSLQDALTSTLERNGFEVEVFDSGYPIVSMMDNWPDIFLIDIELPDINGLEICKWLKSHDDSRDIPVIFLSSDSYLKILAASSHADDYIEKPVTFHELIGKINDVLYTEEE